MKIGPPLNILQLVPQVPYPLTDGGKVGIFNITKHLSLRGHKLTMLALDVSGYADLEALRGLCQLILVPHSNKNSLFGAAVNLFSSLPYNISKYRSREFEKRLRQLLKEGTFDIVHIDHLHMAHYGLLCKEQAGIPVALREHNVESTIVERYAKTARSRILRTWLTMQGDRIRAYEGSLARHMDVCSMITPEDEKRLLELQPDAQTVVIPAGVEEEMFVGGETVGAIPHSMALVGNYEWLPNRDSLGWFLEKIFPLIKASNPLSRAFIIGKNIPTKIKDHPPEGVVIRGFVNDIKRELQQYEILAVPLRVGGGIRLKILESFALRVPVVSTSIGCEGTRAIPGKHLLVADTEREFAAQVVGLLGNVNLQRSLKQNALDLAVEHYRWERIAEQFETVYTGIIQKYQDRNPNGV